MGKDLKGKELGVGIPQEKTERARNTVKLTHLKEIKRNDGKEVLIWEKT